MALGGGMSVCQPVSEFPLPSLVFSLLNIVALPFLINPTSNLKQKRQLFQLRSSGMGSYIQGVSLGLARRDGGVRGTQRSQTKQRCGRNPMLLSSSSQQNILIIWKKKIRSWLEIHQKYLKSGAFGWLGQF